MTDIILSRRFGYRDFALKWFRDIEYVQFLRGYKEALY